MFCKLHSYFKSKTEAYAHLCACASVHLSDVENYFLKIGSNTFIMMFIQNQRTIKLFENEKLMLNISISLENHFFYMPINVYHSFACFN